MVYARWKQNTWTCENNQYLDNILDWHEVFRHLKLKSSNLFCMCMKWKASLPVIHPYEPPHPKLFINVWLIFGTHFHELLLDQTLFYNIIPNSKYLLKGVEMKSFQAVASWKNLYQYQTLILKSSAQSYWSLRNKYSHIFFIFSCTESWSFLRQPQC